MKVLKHNIIQDKSFAFSIRIINLYKYLISDKKEYIISRQLLRSGTSIGANIEEAIGGFSKKDFVSKMTISYKEARETLYWIKLLHMTNYLSVLQYESIYYDCRELLKIMTRILLSSKSVQ